MTAVKYAILHGKREIKRVNTLQEAKEIVSALGTRFSYKVVYIEGLDAEKVLPITPQH